MLHTINFFLSCWQRFFFAACIKTVFFFRFGLWIILINWFVRDAMFNHLFCFQCFSSAYCLSFIFSHICIQKNINNFIDLILLFVFHNFIMFRRTKNVFIILNLNFHVAVCIFLSFYILGTILITWYIGASLFYIFSQ